MPLPCPFLDALTLMACLGLPCSSFSLSRDASHKIATRVAKTRESSLFFTYKGVHGMDRFHPVQCTSR